MHRTLGILLLFLSPLLLAQARPSPPPGGYAGGLLVAPTRVVFEGRTRAAELTLLNTSNQTTTFRISFIQMRMGEHGEMNEVTSLLPDERPADPLIRYSPRQVVLEPGVSQTVRLQLRKPADLAPGEYRSHLVFREVPPELTGANSIDQSQRVGPGVNIRISTIYGVSIPVIVRHGETHATVDLTDLALANNSDGPVAHFKLTRSGNRSVYGNLVATFAWGSGKPLVIGMMNGLAVYTPNRLRWVDMPLRPPPELDLRHGQLTITYQTPDGEGEPLASSAISVP